MIKKILIFLYLASLLSGWFYWFQIRPMNVRKYCVNESMEGNLNKRIKNNNYRICLVKKGLNPESLLVNIE